MKRIETALAECVVFEPDVFHDGHCHRFQCWNAELQRELGLAEGFVQSAVSQCGKGVLRGLDYQWPDPQGMLVGALDGEVYAVAVDIRLGSPGFGRWAAATLNSENRRLLWIPEGFAHGFVVLSETALLNHMSTAADRPGHAARVRWDDASIGIAWPLAAPLLSAGDAQAPRLAELAPDRLPVYA
ncbi:MAG: dTDP-4-dehydrorhamnose 3,5-epimerase [Lysobacteraceae bacterium]|nr:MAG: dTDP-4-dehydrorhamnose 3,5-epimerase [Xanthomonadaceae bacterium]